MNPTIMSQGDTTSEKLLRTSMGSFVGGSVDPMQNITLPSRILTSILDLLTPCWNMVDAIGPYSLDGVRLQHIVSLILALRMDMTFCFINHDSHRFVIPIVEMHFLQTAADPPSRQLFSRMTVPRQGPPPSSAAEQEDRHGCQRPYHTGFTYNWDLIGTDGSILSYLDLNLAPDLFDAKLKHAFSCTKLIVFQNVGSLSSYTDNTAILIRTFHLFGKSQCTAAASFCLARNLSVTLAKPLKDYRFFYVMAPSVSFESFLRRGIINCVCANSTCLLRQTQRCASGNTPLLELQCNSTTALEWHTTLRHLADRISGYYL